MTQPVWVIRLQVRDVKQPSTREGPPGLPWSLVSFTLVYKTRAVDGLDAFEQALAEAEKLGFLVFSTGHSSELHCESPDL